MSVFYTWTSMCARKKWHELKSCRCNNFDDVSQTKWSASEKGKNTCFWILMFFWRDVLLFQAALSKTVLKLYIFCPFVIPTRWHIRAAAAGGTFRRFVASSALQRDVSHLRRRAEKEQGEEVDQEGPPKPKDTPRLRWFNGSQWDHDVAPLLI